jgi:hypothetical protein
MIRKLSLSRLERDITVQLDEAGAEELVMVVNALSDSGQHYPRRRDVIDAFEAAVRRLVGSGQIEILRRKSGMRIRLEGAEANALMPLRRWLQWEAAGNYWIKSPTSNVGTIEIALPS